MSFARLVFRLVVGLLFVGHGSQKLFGAFGGHGPEGTGGFMDSLDMRPGKQMATAAGAAELAGGTLLATGFLTPVATSAITCVMATAGWTVHRPNGIWVDDGGIEYPLVVATSVFALTAAGPGAISLDRALGTERRGLGVAVLSLLGGVAASAAIIATGKSGALAKDADPVPATDAPDIDKAVTGGPEAPAQ